MKTKKLLSVIIVLAMVVSLLPVTVSAASGKYIDCYWDEAKREVVKTYPNIPEDATVINSGTTTWEDGKWYVAEGTLTIGEVTVNGSAHLILKDDCNLTVDGGIRVYTGRKLTVYAQSEGDHMGSLNAIGHQFNSEPHNPYICTTGIGGRGIRTNNPDVSVISCGDVTINGGNVTASSAGKTASGIGASVAQSGSTPNYFYLMGSVGEITINGGNVNASSSSAGAGIGGGINPNNPFLNISRNRDAKIIINGGKVDAKSDLHSALLGNLTLNAGSVSATTEHYDVDNEKLIDCEVIGGHIYITDNNTGERIIKSDGQSLLAAILARISQGSVSFTVTPCRNYVTYQAYNTQTGTYQMKECWDDTNPYTFIGSNATNWQNSWYVADGELTIDGRVSVTGDVKLILKDGCKLTAKKGIYVGRDSTLTIYGQTEGTGKLIAKLGRNVPCCSAIGGGEASNSTNNCDCGVVNIHGGTFDVKGGNSAAGIGGGKGGSGGTVNIYGGDIKAEGGTCSAGIGGGEGNTGGTVNICGGTVTAESGTIGAGIGSGSEGEAVTVNISGGTVTAVGTYGGSGAGIGSGDGVAGTITISGGTVTATGDFCAAGIGCGSYGSFGDIIISGGDVTATATEHAAGIGGNMMFDGGNVSIYKDATVHAIAAEGMPGIKAGTVTVYGTVHDMIHVKQNDADIQGSPFTQTTVIGSLLSDGDVDVLTENSAHSFTGSYVDNGDGTHSQKCTICEARGAATEEHTIVDGKCTLCDFRYKTITLSDGTEITYDDTKFVIDNNGVLTQYKGSDTVVVISEGVKQIGNQVFQNNKTIKEVHIPASVEVVGDNAFYLSSLTKVNFEKNSHLTTIGKSAFREAQLTSFTVPASVKTIKDSSIGGMSSMTVLIFEDGSQLETIGDYAFSSDKLTTVNIPKTVKSIGREAFNGMDFTSVYVNWTEADKIASLGSDFSISTYSAGTLYVPYGTTDLYKAHVVWGKFQNIVEMEPEPDSLTLNITGKDFKVMPNGVDTNKGVVIVALYDSEDMTRLLDVKTFDLTNGDEPEGEFTQSGYVKAMWWSNLDVMTPLCDTVGCEMKITTP